MKILSLSDVVVSYIYSPQVKHSFRDVGMLIDCGDTPYAYLEFVISMLDVPAFYVRGNHSKKLNPLGQYAEVQGAEDLHGRLVYQSGFLLAGVEGSLRYSLGNYQYSQEEMWWHVFKLVPGMFINRMRYGRFLDIFVTHAPPWGIHDDKDLPHQGIKAFRWLLQVFHPAYHFHGHIHTYRPDAEWETRFGQTKVVNSYPYRETVISG